jgi:hypothetical protein
MGGCGQSTASYSRTIWKKWGIPAQDLEGQYVQTKLKRHGKLHSSRTIRRPFSDPLEQITQFGWKDNHDTTLLPSGYLT